jgi:NAD(P)-dependent dehydrogenase (short-subunit alcohol dehydrogenase family)
MASEGADVIAVDIAGKLPPCVPYDSATPDDLAETVQLVEATGRRILASVVDTRDIDGLCAAVDDGVATLGRLDIIVANAASRLRKSGTASLPTTSATSSTST